jgi:16S rRNA (uracil1498-N3)-methyltransferase
VARTPRFFHEEIPAAPGARLELSGDEGRHGAQVLRLEPGREVLVFDGRGGCGRFVVRAVGRAGLSLELVAREDDDREAAVDVALAVALPKPKRLLSLIEKATELGAARFLPLATERTRPGGLKPERLARRAIEAAKQCGRNRIPQVTGPLDVAALARERASVDLAIFGDGDGKPLRDVVRGTTPRAPTSPRA